MAGRGRGAVIPAWMKEGGQDAAPGSSGAAVPSADAWTEHVSPDGRKYYYNAVLKKSSWTKPEGFVPPLAEQSGGAWEEHKAPDGRTYYYNRATKESKWSLPPGSSVVPKPHRTAQPQRPQQPGFVPPPGSLQPGPTPHYATTAEAREAFQSLLKDCQIPSGLSWEQTTAIISVDRRFAGLRSLADRRKLFDEYLLAKGREEKQELDTQQQQFEERFFALFDSCPELVNASVPKFDDAKRRLSSTSEWTMVSTDDERYDLFEKWIDRNIEKKEKEQEALRRNRRQALHDYLEGCSWITLETTWRKAQSMLEDVDEYNILEKYDRIDVFDEFMKKCEEREMSNRDVVEELRIRKERLSRVALRKVLENHLKEGKIHAKMLWKEYLKQVGSGEEIKAVEMNLTGSRPKDLFMDTIEEAEVLYEKEKPIIDSIVRDLSIEFTESSPDVETFNRHVATCGKDIALASIKLYLLEMQSMLKEEGTNGPQKRTNAAMTENPARKRTRQS